MVAAVVYREGKYLLVRRPDKGLLGGLWEFPNGRVKRGETHRAALARILRECLGTPARMGARVATVDHAYSHFTITMDVYRCEISEARIRSCASAILKWVPRSQFRRHAMPKAHHKFLHAIG
jgi:mutator protein MutT